MLTVERGSEEDGLAICFDDEGLALLRRSLDLIARSGANNHDHLTTGAWGGHELDGRPLGDGMIIENHLRLVYRPRGR